MSLQKTIRELIFFYVKTNYEQYLKENNIISISDNNISNVIDNIYTERKEHVQIFIKDSLKTLYKDKMDEYPGDQTIKNLLLNIFQDDETCKNRLILEIQLHQNKKLNK